MPWGYFCPLGRISTKAVNVSVQKSAPFHLVTELLVNVDECHNGVALFYMIRPLCFKDFINQFQCSFAIKLSSFCVDSLSRLLFHTIQGPNFYGVSNLKWNTIIVWFTKSFMRSLFFIFFLKRNLIIWLVISLKKWEKLYFIENSFIQNMRTRLFNL